MSSLTCIIIPLHAKVVTKVMDPTSTPSHCRRSSDNDCCIPSFIDVEAKKCIVHVKDKEEEGMETIGVVRELLCTVPHWLH